MKRLVVLMMFGIAIQSWAVPQQISYQGFLTSLAGVPLDTTVNMTFKLYWDVAGPDSLVWQESHASVMVMEGVFMVSLGDVLPIQPAMLDYPYLQLGITVGNNLEMTPRAEVKAVSYALLTQKANEVVTVNGARGGTIHGELAADTLHTDVLEFGDGTTQACAWDSASLSSRIDAKADSADNATRSWVQNQGYAANAQTYSDTSLWDATKTWVRSMGYLSGADNSVSATGFVGGGNHNKARGDYSVVAGGGGATAVDSNSASGYRSTIGGGAANSAHTMYSTIAGGYANTAWGLYATVAGGYMNMASSETAVVAGGQSNQASGYYAAIGGGQSNQANGYGATISGGMGNQTLGSYATVGGGYFNTASFGQTTIGGGAGNRTLMTGATISGGVDNTASGEYSTVTGGESNQAIGQHSLGAGYRARAHHDGAFVWGSSSSATDSTASFGDHTFTARCAGGARFYTAQTGITTGVSLSAGGGSWSNLCDVRQKRLYGDVNTSDILQKISHLPLHRWSYKSQDEKIQHIGPTAQDFYAAFTLGESDTTINTLDPDGIALAAIQELAKRCDQLEQQNILLQKQIQSMMAKEDQAQLRKE